jgi:hypothetical protein
MSKTDPLSLKTPKFQNRRLTIVILALKRPDFLDLKSPPPNFYSVIFDLRTTNKNPSPTNFDSIQKFLANHRQNHYNSSSVAEYLLTLKLLAKPL